MPERGFFLAWLKTRVPLWFPGLAVLLVVVLDRETALIFRVFVAGTLLLAFRLWDDLADVDEDRVRAPERVLPRLADLRSPKRALALLLGLSQLGLVVTGTRPLLLPILVVAVALYYLGARKALPQLLRAHVLLLKYPAIALLCAPSELTLGPASWTSLFAIFGAAGLYEFAHDPRARAARGATIFFLLDVMAFLLGVSLLALESQ